MNKFSSYLKKKKPLVKLLVNKLNEHYPFVSVLATDVKGKSYSVDRRSIAIRPSSITECGFVCKVYSKGVYSEYSFNELEEKNIDNIIKEIESLVNNNIKTNKVDCEMLIEEPLKKSFIRKDNKTIYTDEQILDILKEAKDYGVSLSNNVLNVSVSHEILETSKMYISNSKELDQYYTWNNTRCMVLVRKENNMKYAYDGSSSNCMEDTLSSINEVIKKTTELAMELLDSTLPIPGTYTVITDPSITGLIAHEAFGHGLEMDMFVKDRAKAKEFMNKEVAKPILSMKDGANSAFSVASYFFDDEGVLAQDTQIIDKGVLVGGICDSISASILNYKPTGNGRRESYKRKAYTRMTNTFFDKGESSLEEMIKSVDYGYYISTTNNGMEDPKNWGIQCTALYGREIKDGKFTGKMISPVVMSGYVIDLLQSISMVSNDFEIHGSGSCGKGYKEWVRVSDGGSCLKAQVKIG